MREILFQYLLVELLRPSAGRAFLRDKHGVFLRHGMRVGMSVVLERANNEKLLFLNLFPRFCVFCVCVQWCLHIQILGVGSRCS